MTRRIKVVLSASGAGESPSASSRARMNRSISLIGQAGVLDGGQRGLARRLERPVRRPRRPLLDPAPQHRDLLGRQLLAALLGRHLQLGVVVLDPIDQVALIGLARHDRRLAPLKLGERPFLGVEPQLGFALLIVGPVAGETVVRKDRPDLPREIHGPRRAVAWRCIQARVCRAEPVLTRNEKTTAIRSQNAMFLPLDPLAARPPSSGSNTDVPAATQLKARSIVRDLSVMGVRL